MTKTISLFAFAFTIGWIACSSPVFSAENDKQAIKEIKGKWVATDVNYFGKTPPKDIIEKVTIEVEDKKIEIASIAYGNGKFSIDKKPFSAFYKLNANASPKEIDIALKSGGQVLRMLGIYSISEDQFKLCIQVEGDTRPVELAGSESPPLMLFTLQREKE